MPPQEHAFLFDKAVIWELAGVDSENEPTILTPYEISVRWDDSTGKILDATGQLVNFDAQVMAAEDYPLGSIFWLGLLADLPDPVTGIDLYRSIFREATRDIRNVDTSYLYSLKRFHQTLPDIIGTS